MSPGSARGALLWVLFFWLGAMAASAPAGAASLQSVSHNIPGDVISASPFSGAMDINVTTDDVYQINCDGGRKISWRSPGRDNDTFSLYLYPPGSTDIELDAIVAAATDLIYPNRLRDIVPQGGEGT